MEVKQQSPRPFFRPSSGGAFRTSGVGGAALLTPKVEADASPVSSASLVLVSTVIKTEPRSDSPCASISMGRFRSPTDRYSTYSFSFPFLFFSLFFFYFILLYFTCFSFILQVFIFNVYFIYRMMVQIDWLIINSAVSSSGRSYDLNFYFIAN